jgi:hypothetical protein
MESLRLVSVGDEDWRPQFQNLVGPWKQLHKHLEIKRLAIDLISSPSASSALPPSIHGRRPVATAASPSMASADAGLSIGIGSGHGMYAVMQSHAEQMRLSAAASAAHAHADGTIIAIQTNARVGEFIILIWIATLCFAPDVLFLAPRLDVRVRLYLQPLMSNFRPVPRRKLLAAAASGGPGSPVAACGAAVALDVHLSEPLQVNVARQQVAFALQI